MNYCDQYQYEIINTLTGMIIWRTNSHAAAWLYITRHPGTAFYEVA